MQSRIASELDETFVSPVLENIRRRMRHDPEISKITPFQASCQRGSKRVKETLPVANECDPTMAWLSSPQGKHQAICHRLVDKARNNEMAAKTLLRVAFYALRSSMWWPAKLPYKLFAINRVIVLPPFGSKLPPLQSDVSARIFCFLTNSDLHNANFVSHLWNQFALGDMVWDHANLIPIRAARSRKKRNGKANDVDYKTRLKREANLAVLSTLRQNAT
ncbi:hypothetical protein PsorP6_007760 [Peronosclerospora sorghi]|uniref:Uncharacterized protein n=1 Tax=Peronosclerospora sorghi TaxID=230839 RepID=A0ACC0W8C9_9STRA|nr:hypothetical protein PsorP6_007760 [Peronosclerospora sorghi]